MASTFSAIPLLQALKVFGAANAVGWLISVATGSHIHIDLLGTGAFVAASTMTLPAPNVAFGLRQQISALIIRVWGIRLASFLFCRALRVQHDKRLDGTLDSLAGTTGFWFVSFIWGAVCFLPHALAAGVAPLRFGPWGIAGATVAILGVGVEAMADIQKWIFKQDTANQGKFCGVGLWAVSQHPNYLGNLLLWSGITILNSPSLLCGPTWALPLACISPIFMYLLLSAQATGQISNAVELSFEKYGNDIDFVDYTSRVPLIFPWCSGPGPHKGVAV